MQPYYNQQQSNQIPMQDQQYQQQCFPPQPAMEYNQPQMGFQPMNYQPNQQLPHTANYYQVSPQPILPVSIVQPPPQQQDVSVKVEVKSQTPAGVVAPLVVARESWTTSRYSTLVYCTNCKQNVTTLVVYSFGNGSCLMVCIFCLVFWPIMCLPFCIPAMQDAIHHCPVCGAVLGKNEFLCS